jgi:hypothetical protein
VINHIKDDSNPADDSYYIEVHLAPTYGTTAVPETTKDRIKNIVFKWKLIWRIYVAFRYILGCDARSWEEFSVSPETAKKLITSLEEYKFSTTVGPVPKRQDENLLHFK